jgi:hypothetical protein
MKEAGAKAQAGDYLAGLLGNSGGADSRDDLQVTIAAVRGYAQLMAGEAAVPLLAQALERNKIRADGYQEMVGLEIVKALDETGSARAAQLALQYQKDTSIPDVTYWVETSSDLTNWTTPPEITESIESSNGSVQNIKAVVPVGSNGQRFIRLRVAK